MMITSDYTTAGYSSFTPYVANGTTITFTSQKPKTEALAEITKLISKLTDKGFNVTDFQIEFK